MTPSAGASRPSIARWEKCGRAWIPSSVKSSQSSSIRSRAVSLPAACWRAILSSPPPSRALARRSSRSSASGRNMPVACQPRVREAQDSGNAGGLARQGNGRGAAADAAAALAERTGGDGHRVRVAQQRAQLHAAEPVDMAMADQAVLEPRAEAGEQRVARHVAVGVVEAAHSVEIEERERRLATLGPQPTE